MSTELAADRVPEEASGTDSHKSSSVLLSELYDLVRTKHGRSSVSPSAGEKSAAAASKTAQDVCTSSTDVTMASNQAAINLTTSSVSRNADTSERAVRSSSRDRRRRSPDSSRQCDKRSSTSRNRRRTGSHSGRKYRRDRSPSGSGSRNDERHSRRTRRHDSLTSSNDRSSDDDARDKRRRHHHHHRRRSRRTSSSPSSRSSSTSRRSRSRRRTSKRTKTSKDKDGRKRTGARESDRESSRSDSHQRSVSPSSRHHHHHSHHHHGSSRHYHNRHQRRHHSPRASNNRHRRSSSPRSHEDRIDKRKLLEVARENAARILAAQSHHSGHHVLTPSSTSSSSSAVVTSSRPVSTAVMSSYSVRQDVMCASVNQLTEICRQVRDGTGTVHYTPPVRSCTSGSPSLERCGAAGSMTSSTNTLASAVVLNSARLGAIDRQLVKATVTSQFPVSSGEQHREHESTSGPHHSASSAQTADAHTNEASAGDTNDQVFPTSSTVMARGCLYGATPGEFTGSTGAKTLTAAQLNTGYQAWARKDQLRCTEPVRGGFGELMMKKMGWQPGRGLGKHQHGSLEPISVDVKNDKRGLLADGERKARKTANSLAHTPSGKMIGGKNPVSVLMEYSNKTRCSPVFEVIFEGGPSHLRNFLFKVSVNGRSFQPSKPSQNKKLAKAEAAMLALQGLGLLTSSTGDVTAPGQSNHAQPPHHMPFVSNGFYEHDETNAANLAHDVHQGGFAPPAPVPHRPAHKTLLPTPIGYGSVTSSINHAHMPVNATLFAPPPSR